MILFFLLKNNAPQEAEDTNYQEEGEAADVFDSDFDEDVSSCNCGSFLFHFFNSL